MPDYTKELAAVLKRAEPLAQAFLSAGYGFYLVGGVVRDNFLGRVGNGQDLDATTDARPDEIKALAADLAEDLWFQGERFGTVGCVVDGQTYEITTHRAESYREDSRQPLVVFGDSIVADLQRRDFTVNAMAINLADASLVDPFRGELDLRAKVLRTPLAPVVSLSEDPLRMLRAARFCAGCELEAVPELKEAMVNQADRLAIISVERIRDEIQKLLLLDDPTAGLSLLDETGVASLVPVVGGFGPWLRAGSCVAAMPSDAVMRWAAFLVSLGAEKANLRELKFSGQMARQAGWMAVQGGSLVGEDLSTLTDRRLRVLAQSVPAGRTVEDLLTFVSGLRIGFGHPLEDVSDAVALVADLRRREPDFDDPQPSLGGLEVAELLSIEPGPKLGKALAFLRELRITHGPQDRELVVNQLHDWWMSRSR